MDNKTDTEKELSTRFALLPEEIQKAITSSDYQMKLFDIAKKYKFTYEQLGKLEMETTLTLLGMTHPNDYITSLTEQLGKKKEEIEPLVNEIKTQVFDPIRDSLMGLYAKPTDGSLDNATADANKIFQKAGVSLTSNTPQTTPSAPVTENRSDILKGIENPTKSNPLVLNEKPAVAPVAKPIGAAGIPVPRAPYAAPAPAAQTKAPTPMTAQPAGSIVDSKLGGSFNMAAKDSDHSIKKVTPAAPPAPRGGDSYREPIE